MDIFNEIFQDLNFIRYKLVNGFFMYVAKIENMIGIEYKYVILLVPVNESGLKFAKIYELNWRSLQTRLIMDDYNLEPQFLDPKLLDHRYYHDKFKLSLKNRTDTQSEYFSTLPINILLLNNPKKKSVYQYADNIDLRSALNTFHCVISKI